MPAPQNGNLPPPPHPPGPHPHQPQAAPPAEAPAEAKNRKGMSGIAVILIGILCLFTGAAALLLVNSFTHHETPAVSDDAAEKSAAVSPPKAVSGERSYRRQCSSSAWIEDCRAATPAELKKCGFSETLELSGVILVCPQVRFEAAKEAAESGKGDAYVCDCESRHNG
jgi:hypothetical protein